MSRRKPRKGKSFQPGDRVIVQIPPGPASDMILLYGGDAQSAVVAALTLMCVVLRGGLAGQSVQPPVPNQQVQEQVQPQLDARMARVAATDLFGGL